MFILLTIPTALAIGNENNILNVDGNQSTLRFNLTTIQSTVNPTIGANITYITIVNVSTVDAEVTFNLTDFCFYLPDNRSTVEYLDFGLNHNETDIQANASSMISTDAANWNYANFSNMGALALPPFNDSVNGTAFNITWMLESPITQVKISTSQIGRTYTELWNITSLATNLTIVNSSLTITPVYWHTIIGVPSVTFNDTTKIYEANSTGVTAYTDLNLSSNLQEFGSGWETLSIVYNGPSIDKSGGSSSSTLSVVPTVLGDILQDKKKLAGFVGLIVLVLGGIGTVVYFVWIRK